MDISSQEIEAIVKQVLAGMGGAQTSAAPAAYTAAPGGAAGDRGVFENVDDAVEAAWKAQRDWAANYKIEDRQRIIEAIRRCARAHVEEWCHKIVEETGMGRYEDKVEKHLAVINKTPGPECLTTEANLGDGVFPGPHYLEHNGVWGIGSDSHISVSVSASTRATTPRPRFFCAPSTFVMRRFRRSTVPPKHVVAGSARTLDCTAASSVRL